MDVYVSVNVCVSVQDIKSKICGVGLSARVCDWLLLLELYEYCARGCIEY